MARVICTLPNASSLISGIRFHPLDGEPGMISDEIDDTVAERLASIPGYELDEEDRGQEPGKPAEPPVKSKKQTAAEKKAEKKAAEEKAAQEAAEKEAAEQAAREAAEAAEKAKKSGEAEKPAEDDQDGGDAGQSKTDGAADDNNEVF